MRLSPDYVIEFTANGRDWLFYGEAQQQSKALQVLRCGRTLARINGQKRRFRCLKISKSVIDYEQ